MGRHLARWCRTQEVTCSSLPIDLSSTIAVTRSISPQTSAVCVAVVNSGWSHRAGSVGRALRMVRARHAAVDRAAARLRRLGETQRFEAWAVQPGWRGSWRCRGAGAVPCRAIACSRRTARARLHGRWSVCRGGRPVWCPMPSAGMLSTELADPARADTCSAGSRGPMADDVNCSASCARPSDGLVRSPSRWADHRCRPCGCAGGMGGGRRRRRHAVRGSRVRRGSQDAFPFRQRCSTGRMRKLVLGRTLLIIAGDEPRPDGEACWTRRSMHPGTVVLFAGARPVAACTPCCLERQSIETLVASVCPPSLWPSPHCVTSPPRRGVPKGARSIRAAAVRQRSRRYRRTRPCTWVGSGRGCTSRRTAWQRRGVRRGGARAGPQSAQRAARRSPHDGGERSRSWPAPGEIARLRARSNRAVDCWRADVTDRASG